MASKRRQYFAYEDILRVWLEADTVPDIDHAWLFDHPMPILRSNPSGPCLDGWTLLAALAAQTTRLRLGLMVASNVNQTPPWLAKRAATVDIISRGRLEFGLGAGGVEREHEAYGTDFFPPAEASGAWAKPARSSGDCGPSRSSIRGALLSLQRSLLRTQTGSATYAALCDRGRRRAIEPARCGAPRRHLELPGFPHTSVEEFAQKPVLDNYCAEIRRDPASLARSVQITFDPAEPPAATRQIIQGFIDAGATHLVLAPRVQRQGIAHWLSAEIIQPLKAANA